MIFKRKKNMSENVGNNSQTLNENADNMSEQVESVVSSQDAPAAASIVEVNSEKIEMLIAEVEEHKEKYLRLAAEYDNFRKRSRKERFELEQSAGKDVIKSLLVVMDDMDRAAKQLSSSNDLELIREGVQLVFNKMRSTLEKKGLRRMETKTEPFNPDLHEAITEIPVPDPDMDGKIFDVVEPGYYLNDMLIRHAKVVLAKATE